MTGWQVVADDRTGAYEVAGLLAGPDAVCVSVGAPEGSVGGVIDIATRGLDTAAAALVAGGLVGGGWRGHKIDSTLRGNWAAEVRARRIATGRRLIVVPAWPDMGRTCVAGVVKVFHEVVGDVKDHLPEAVVVPHAAALRHWWDGSRAVAVCDVPDTESMQSLAAMIAGFPDEQVLVAGPAGPLAAVLWARWGGRPTPAPAPEVRLPALVVCGSANPVAHRQLGQLRMVAPDVEVLAVDPLTPKPARPASVARDTAAGDVRRGDVRGGVEEDAADAADDALDPAHALALGERARRRIGDGDIETLVIVGGDTVAAVLGDAARMVGGMIAPGMPWSRDATGGGPLVVTKAGGFGGVDAVARLFTAGGTSTGKTG